MKQTALWPLSDLLNEWFASNGSRVLGASRFREVWCAYKLPGWWLQKTKRWAHHQMWEIFGLLQWAKLTIHLHGSSSRLICSMTAKSAPWRVQLTVDWNVPDTGRPIFYFCKSEDCSVYFIFCMWYWWNKHFMIAGKRRLSKSFYNLH